ncbi:L,D-transpeptidase [Tranquillimonas rosea]|nr:L,D-transpeptidase [Tranquillimonas rosea]
MGPPHDSPQSFEPRNVDVRDDAEVGSIHVVPQWFVLYYVTSPGRAIEYHTAVGEAGRNLTGRVTVKRKEEWPSWTPTQNMIRREPEMYGKYADGVPGGPENPLGARALYLYRGGRDTMYRIHGTPQPWTIGTAVSSGCIRLKNEHIIDLYNRVEIGAPVRIYPPI